MKKTKILLVFLVLVSICLGALESRAETFYYSYDSSGPSSTDFEVSNKYREQVKYELTENFERTDNIERLRRNRFLYDSPYYNNRVIYNRGYGYRSGYSSDYGYFSTPVSKYSRIERYERDLSMDTNERSRAYTGARLQYAMPMYSRYSSRNMRNLNNNNIYMPIMRY